MRPPDDVPLARSCPDLVGPAVAPIGMVAILGCLSNRSRGPGRHAPCRNGRGAPCCILQPACGRDAAREGRLSSIDVLDTDILILGAGGAGLCAALHAADAH